MTDPEIRYDRSLLGVERPAGSFRISKEMILAYCQAVGETNPLHTDEEAAKQSAYGGLIAPPTFCNILISGLKRPDIGLEYGDLNLLASQAQEYLAPVRPGDTLEARIKLTDVYAKTGRSGMMVFYVWALTFVNQEGAPVATVQDSFVRRNRS